MSPDPPNLRLYFSGVSNLVVDQSPHCGVSPGCPTSRHSLSRPADQNSDLCPDFWALFPAHRRALQPPQSRAWWTLVSGLSASPTKSPEPRGFQKYLCPQTHLARRRVRQDVAKLLPRPGKRLGIAPSFPQIWSLSPGIPRGWALPPDIGDCPRGLAHLQLRPPPAAQSARCCLGS